MKEYTIVHYPRKDKYLVTYGKKHYLWRDTLTGDVNLTKDEDYATVFLSREDCINAIHTLNEGPLVEKEIYVYKTPDERR